ncbi:MAG: S46 family peptidase, partial [Myxococcota bacterium]|nr:S46 family peptidase [Myxococcota bacterium]
QPLGSIVTLGFCSAAFVSPDGLIATNHHCVAGYLQYLSDAENDRNESGYLAATRAEEAWVGPGSEVQVVQKITDVTAEVNAGVSRRTGDAAREAIVSKNTKAIVAGCEADRPDVQCRVASYYGGSEYRLIEKRRLKDVRLVYAPPDSVGAFGGEIDNWMWPRHSGDFALLRAYVGPDGSAAEHAEDNIAYRPPHHLEVNPDGASPGDFVMVAGYPGRTYRFRRARSMTFARDVAYPFGIGLSEEMRAILQDHADRSADAKARLTAQIGYIDNGLKYRKGMLDGFSGSDVIERKAASEDALMAWVAADRKRSRRYGPVFAEMDAMADASDRTYRSEAVSGWMLGIDLLSAAYTGWRWACEREKPDLERDRGYQDRDREKRLRRLERLEKTMWTPAGRDALTLLLEKLAALPADQRPGPVLDWVEAQGGIAAAVDKLHEDPALAATENRVSLLDMDKATLAASTDPWVQLAIALDAYNAPIRQRDRERKGANLRLQPLYFEAMRAASEGEVYPDANSTLRVTVGHVKGYAPQDGLVATP